MLNLSIAIILSYIFQITQIGCNYISSWVKSKNNIILFKTLSAISSFLMLLSVGQFVGALPVLFTAVRSFLFMYKKRFKTNAILYICIFIYFIIALVSVDFSNEINVIIKDLLPTVISVSASIILWCLNPIGIKIGLSITDSIWIVYYLMVGLYLSAFNNTIQVVLSIISAVKIKNTSKKIGEGQNNEK